MNAKQVKRLRREVKNSGIAVSNRGWRQLKRAHMEDPTTFDLFQEARTIPDRDFLARVSNLSRAQARAALESLRERTDPERVEAFKTILRAHGKL